MKEAPKVVSLSVHNSQIDRRARREICSQIKELAHHLPDDVDGFALTIWTKDRSARSCWIQGGLPESVVPEFVKGSLQRQIGMTDAQFAIFGEPPDEGA